MKRSLTSLLLALFLQGCTAASPMLRTDQEPTAVANIIAQQGGEDPVEPPTVPVDAPQGYFTAIDVAEWMAKFTAYLALKALQCYHH